MKQATYTVLAALLVMLLSSQVLAPDTLVPDSTYGSKTLIYTFAIKDNIAAPTWRITQEAFEEALALKADVVGRCGDSSPEHLWRRSKCCRLHPDKNSECPYACPCVYR